MEQSFRFYFEGAPPALPDDVLARLPLGPDGRARRRAGRATLKSAAADHDARRARSRRRGKMAAASRRANRR